MYLISILLNVALANPIEDLAVSNGYRPSTRVISAISFASKAYSLNPLELTAIGILESGLGQFKTLRVNKNGTIDVGLFQINSVNLHKCTEYNVETIEGSALCAAKLLSSIKAKHKDYLGRYHSKTPSKKNAYHAKVKRLLAFNR